MPLNHGEMVKLRFNSLRLQMCLPEMPTKEHVQTLSRFAEAELKDIVAHGRGQKTQVNATSAGRKKGSSKSGAKGSDKPAASGKNELELCNGFQKKESCPGGKACRWEHPFVPIGDRRCQNCGAPERIIKD